MAQLTFKGNPIQIAGEPPKVGDKAKDFTLVKGDLSRVSLKDFKGERLVLNVFLSLDTGTCAASVRNFNKAAANLENTKVLCISKDLPFAQSRFCEAEGIENVIMLSDFATGQFGKDYGIAITNEPLEGLLSRTVIVIDEKGTVSYVQQVTENSHEPDYEDVLKVLK
ncbi:thiol peroxidase (atypical 2-Cys peroxiredoxin) [Tangfeifania diversioriginum]|uniref:Thiol peroxidase n=1 Tax=Tangfeifania diversioriginum TaxID=1168035 RepID=A0A1M6KQQ1_9BACT|nr:thiol peroxidase [Tangfeifania diversioriginum]SHJ61214.1 thiol peroxidase (atypical 2-Cys peroxiredoxin) [Tangfeifania diversioriginum]